MEPSGEGANLAMFDSAELANAIAANKDDWEAARMQEVIFGDNPPQPLLHFAKNQPIR